MADNYKSYYLTLLGVKRAQLHQFVEKIEENRGYTERGILLSKFNCEYNSHIKVVYFPFSLIDSLGIMCATNYVQTTKREDLVVAFCCLPEITKTFLTTYTHDQSIDDDSALNPGPYKLTIELSEYYEMKFNVSDPLIYYQRKTIECFNHHIALARSHFSELRKFGNSFTCKFASLDETKKRDDVTFFATEETPKQDLLLHFLIEGYSFDVEVEQEANNDPLPTPISVWHKKDGVSVRETIVHHTNQCLQCGVSVSPAKKCGRCKNAIYCSSECQRTHWVIAHRFNCTVSKKE